MKLLKLKIQLWMCYELGVICDKLRDCSFYLHTCFARKSYALWCKHVDLVEEKIEVGYFKFRQQEIKHGKRKEQREKN